MPPVVAEGAPNGLCVGPPNTEDEAGCCVVAPKGEGEAVDPKPNPVVDGVVPPKVLVPVVGWPKPNPPVVPVVPPNDVLGNVDWGVVPKVVPPVVPKPVSLSVLGPNLDLVVTSLRLPVVPVPPNVLLPNAEGCGVVAPNADGAGEPNENGVVPKLISMAHRSKKKKNTKMTSAQIMWYIYKKVLR
jgi:hypothetical protein